VRPETLGQKSQGGTARLGKDSILLRVGGAKNEEGIIILPTFRAPNGGITFEGLMNGWLVREGEKGRYSWCRTSIEDWTRKTDFGPIGVRERGEKEMDTISDLLGREEKMRRDYLGSRGSAN